MSDKAGSVGDSVSAAAGTVSDRASGAGTISDTTPSAQDVKQAARRARGLAQENPLGLAIGSIAVGFLAGMLVPTTRVEDEKIGPMADTLKEHSKEAALLLGGTTSTAGGRRKRQRGAGHAAPLP